MVFRIQANHFRITYSQANDPTYTKELIYDKWKNEHNLKYICVAKEFHADGGTHYHVHLWYDTRKDLRSEKYFDLPGIPHPNIQKAHNPDGWNRYCKEDGDYVENQEYTDQEEEEDIYIIASRMERNQFFNHCRRKRIAYQYAKDAWDNANLVTSTITEAPTEGTVNPMLNWYQPIVDRKATVIVGPTGVGKTVWALRNATKPTLFCSHIDDLKQLRPNYHKSVIFDDMSFKHWNTQSQIHIVDYERKRTINVKHTVVGIPAGMEKWFTCNEYPFAENDFGAIRRRINLINLF